MSESSNPNKRNYLNRLNDWPDHKLFFLALCVGGGGIVFLKYLGVSQWLTTFFPVFIMITYALVSYRTKQFQLRADRIGENLYYLGLLYTLISLAISLIQFESGPNAPFEIIANFGIAIFTTIAGLTGRVVFYQLREDPVDYERQARSDLAEASNAVRDVLRDTANNFEVFKDGLTQRVEEGVTNIVGQAAKSMEGVVGNFAGVSRGVVEKIDEAFKGFSEQSSRLNKIAGGTVDALEALLKRINNIDASPDLLGKKLEPVIQLFSEMTSEIGAFVKDQTKVGKQMKLFAETTHTTLLESNSSTQNITATLKTHLETLNSSTDRLIGGFGRLEEKIRNLETAMGPSLDQAYQALHGLRTSITEDVEVIKRHRKELESLVASSRTMVGDVHRAMSSLAQSIVKGVDGQ